MALQTHRVYGNGLLAENAQVATKVFLPPISPHLLDSTFVQGGKADFQLEQFNPPIPNLHSKLSSLILIEYFPTIDYKCSLKCAEFTQEQCPYNSNKEAPFLIP